MPIPVSKVAKAVKLLSASLAFVGGPSLKSGLSVHDAAQKLLKSPPKRFSDLADDLATNADALFSAYPDTPPDAPVLFAQMVTASLPDPALVADAGLDPVQVVEAMRAKLTDPDHLRAPMPALFTALTLPAVKTLLANRDVIDDITPALWAELLQTQDAVAETTADTNTRIRNMEQMMTALIAGEVLTLPEMTTLAGQFGEHRITDKGSLTAFLTEKARDYQALLAQAKAIPDTFERLSNVKSAALAAIEDGDFDRAADLLANVRAITKEEDAKAAELQADVELLRGRVQAACDLLCDAADGFRIIDPLEPARRKILGYAEKLGRHGMRYGGDGLPLSVQLMRDTATDALKQADPRLWGAAKNAEALGLQSLGMRAAGSESAKLLAQSVDAYRAALEIYTKDDHPERWAMVQNNLGGLLREQGSLTDGAAGAQLLDQSIAACKSALEIRTRSDAPVEWAMTQNNLANAYSEQGIRVDGEASATLLGKAVTAFRAALEVFTREDYPEHWAQLQGNLANALNLQGERSELEDSRDLLRQAIEAHKAALEIRTRERNPVAWAMTQGNLGKALVALGIRFEGEDAQVHLSQAVSAYQAALTVRTRTDFPIDWALTQTGLGNALCKQGILASGNSGSELLAQSIAAYRAAIEVTTREDHPIDWAAAHENMAIALFAHSQQDANSDRQRDQTEALTAIDTALTIYYPEHMPHHHAKATRLRDEILAALRA